MKGSKNYFSPMKIIAFALLFLVPQIAAAAVDPSEKLTSIEYDKWQAPEANDELVCEDLSVDYFIKYQQLETINLHFLVAYLEKAQEAVIQWETVFDTLAGQNVNFPKSYFTPISELYLSLVDMHNISLANSNRLDDHLYFFIDIAPDCIDNTMFVVRMDRYNMRVRETETQLRKYLMAISKSINTKYEKLKSYEETAVLVPLDEFNGLKKLTGEQLGSSGIGEALELFQTKFKDVYKKELDALMSDYKKISQKGEE